MLFSNSFQHKKRFVLFVKHLENTSYFYKKLVAEKYLRASGLDYTIVRPGGLKGKAPTGALSINKENTLNSGEISRDLVADVCVASLNDAKASNTVLEIIEDDGTPPKVFNGLNM